MHGVRCAQQEYQQIFANRYHYTPRTQPRHIHHTHIHMNGHITNTINSVTKFFKEKLNCDRTMRNKNIAHISNEYRYYSTFLCVNERDTHKIICKIFF